jgi:hypothetical protein
MSYTLDFWEIPRPQTFAETITISESLRSDQASVPQNPKFLVLAERLTSRFPCTMDIEVESDHEVWSDGPVDGQSTDHWWGVGILTQHAGTVVPFAVEAARALGLVAFDPQEGKAYLPDGKILSHADAHPVQSLPKKVKPWWRLW